MTRVTVSPAIAELTVKFKGLTGHMPCMFEEWGFDLTRMMYVW